MQKESIKFSEQELLSRYPFKSGHPVLVDAGAHRGRVSLLFARQGWRVIAFEPEPGNREQFQKNLAGFEKVICLDRVLSDAAGVTCDFYVSDRHPGIHALKPFHETHRAAFRVTTSTLACELEEQKINEVTMLKIDVEGADFPVLKGFDFERFQPEVVLVEFMDSRSRPNYAYTHHDVAAYMKARGYEPFISEWAPIREYSTPHQWVGFGQYPLAHEPAWGNLLFVRSENVRKLKKTYRQYMADLRFRSWRRAPSGIVLLAKTALKFLWRKSTERYACMEQGYLSLRRQRLLSAWRKVEKKETDAQVWAEARREFYSKHGPIPCSRQECRRLQGLKNQYAGRRIFIMGNGPSLNRMDLDKLKNEFTFGTNRIYLLFDRISWRPTFYTTLDWRVTPDNLQEINGLNGMTFFFPERFSGLLRPGSDVFWFWSRYSFFYGGQATEDRFSFDVTRGVCPGGTITVAAIQLAFYMGFDPIYLMGCDTSYNIPATVKQSGPDPFGDGIGLHLESTQNDDANHFDSAYFGKGKKWHNPNVAGMIQGYQNCRAAIEARGGHIYNATAGGELEVFERVLFDSLF